jgi:hypothetical protein
MSLIFARRPSAMLTGMVLMAMLFCAVLCCRRTRRRVRPSIFTVSGFGTAGMVHSSEHRADYTNSPWYKPVGAGYNQNWSPDVDSRFGMQLDARFTEQFSAVVQAISQLRYDNTYKPTIEWANLKYQFTPDFDIRLGRIVMSTFFGFRLSQCRLCHALGASAARSLQHDARLDQ